MVMGKFGGIGVRTGLSRKAIETSHDEREWPTSPAVRTGLSRKAIETSWGRGGGGRRRGSEQDSAERRLRHSAEHNSGRCSRRVRTGLSRKAIETPTTLRSSLLASAVRTGLSRKAIETTRGRWLWASLPVRTGLSRKAIETNSRPRLSWNRGRPNRTQPKGD